MCKSKKKVTRHKSKKTKIPQEALTIKDDIDYSKMAPVFKFSSVDSRKWTLPEWKANEIKDLLKTFKMMEQLSWNDIRQHNGLRVKAIKNITRPPHISPDVTIQEIRVCDTKRIFGFVDKNVFNLLWFDRDHSVCPEGKIRKYG